MKKVILIVVAGLLLCNVVQANIILSKCYITKYKNSPKYEEKEFNYKMFEDRSFEIDLANKIVTKVTIESEDRYQKDINRIKGKKGWLGLRIQLVTEEIANVEKLDRPRGALVASVYKESPIDKAGVIAGDIILEFDGKTINSWRDLPKISGETAVGKNVKAKVWRNKKEIIKKIIVGDFQKHDPELIQSILKRYSITNANIIKIEKEIITAVTNSSENNKLKYFEFILNTKKKTVISKAFKPNEQNISFSVIEKQCE